VTNAIFAVIGNRIRTSPIDPKLLKISDATR
jgi:CO/xanthine dehydrogenase Mo-binding subunit